MRDSPLIINLFGGPGSGKSTAAAGVFYHLKMLHVNVELVLEFARELTHEKRHTALDNQPYIFGEQLHRMHRLFGETDAIITDSPLINSLVYLKDNGAPIKNSFESLILDSYRSMDNMNFYIQRGNGPYKKEGRLQDENEALEVDTVILDLLEKYKISFESIKSDGSSVQEILLHAVPELRK